METGAMGSWAINSSSAAAACSYLIFVHYYIPHLSDEGYRFADPAAAGCHSTILSRGLNIASLALYAVLPDREFPASIRAHRSGCVSPAADAVSHHSLCSVAPGTQSG